MPMTREQHETLLNDLLNPELEQSRRTEILQEMRVDYGTVLVDDETQKSKIKKLELDNSDLVLSNSKLFRQVGITEPNKKEDEQKDFSQTVTLEQLEKE
jgi:Phi29 scaffolding protein.